MAEIGIIQFELTGWNGAPGTNTYAISPNQALPDWEQRAAQAASELASVYTVLRNVAPSGWTATATGVVRVVEDTTGALLGVGAYGPPSPVTSPVTPAEGRSNRASQIVARYRTTDVHAGRLIRGRSFLGPVIPAAFDNDGMIPLALRNDLEQAYGGLISGLGPLLAVWSRPRADPDLGSVPGAYGDVVEVTISPVPGVLRSRRD